MEIVFKAKRKIKPIRTHARKQIGDGIKPLRPLEVYEPTLQPLSLKVFDIVKPLQMEIDKIEQKYKRKLQDRTNKRADVEFRELTEIDRIKNYLKEKVKQYARTYSFLKVGKITARVRELLKFNRAKIIALFKKAKALDKALDKAIQTPSKHR